MDDGRIHLVYGSDDNYAYPTMVSAASAAKCLGDGRRLTVHLFDAGVSNAHWMEFRDRVCSFGKDVVCERHVLRPDMFAGFGDWKGSVVTYSRMFVAELLPDLDWALYYDGDTLWTGDIGKLWELRDEAKLILASIDPPAPLPGEDEELTWYRRHGLDLDMRGYLCMGLMLANLRLMRDRGVPEKCRQFMKRYPCPRVVDQTVLNYVCQGGVAALPPEWGVFSAWHGTADLTKDGAIHYVSDVPWRRDKPNRLLSDVVMLWMDFCRVALGRDVLREQTSAFGRIWRRLLFAFLKHNQWVLKIHPFVKSRFRNTHGLSVKERNAISNRLLRDKYADTKS